MNIVASGSALRKFFACLLQSAPRAKDRTEKAAILGLEALLSVPELRTAVPTKASDDNLYRCAYTTNKAATKATAVKQQHSSNKIAAQQVAM